MAIEFRCPTCQRLLRVPDEAAGVQAQCPECGAIATVPPLSPGPPPGSPVGAEWPGGESAGGRPSADEGGPPGEPPFGLPGPPPSRAPGEVNPFQSPTGSGPTLPGQVNPVEVARYAAMRVSGPAMALLVIGWIQIALQACFLLANLSQAGAQNIWFQGQQIRVNPGLAVLGNAIQIVVGILVVVGASKMQALQNYGLAMTAAILAMIPCVFCPCCFLGVPFGIWALTVLNDPWVKTAFRS